MANSRDPIRADLIKSTRLNHKFGSFDLSVKVTMQSWRMALRVGMHGENLWPLCRINRVAAITYDPIRTTDLTAHEDNARPLQWAELSGSQFGSMNAFGWGIRAGDSLYVRESGTGGMMVGFGTVKGNLYRRAYRFDPGSPIREANGRVWHHLLDVDWDHSFSQFKYKNRSPNTTVLKAKTDEAAEWVLQSARASHVGEDLSPAEVNRALLLESSYSRYTAPAIRLIT